MTPPRAALPILASILLAAACGDSSNGASGTPSGTSSGPSPGLSAGMSKPSSGALPPAPPRNGPLRPGDLLDAPDRYVNRSVEVEIVENLRGPATPEVLATTVYGQIPIDMPDSRSAELALVTADYKPNDPSRYMHKFDRIIQAPIRVRGDFLKDDDLEKQSHRPAYVIRVASIEPLPKETPVRLGSLTDLKADPARWDRRRVIYEGVYLTGFEVSTLDREIWLACESPGCETVNEPATPPRGRSANHVRVTGVLFAKPGQRYGHLGSGAFQLNAAKIEYLGPAPSQ